MKFKRGQVTIFIIIAILVIAAVALFFTLRGTFQRGGVYAPEVVPVKNFVDECLEDTVFESIQVLGSRGGYYFVPEPSKKLFPSEVPYYWYLNKSLMPSKEIIEAEFSKYIEENLQNCIKDFVVFEEQGYEIKQRDISVSTELFLDQIVISLDYPLTIRKGEFSGRINSFNKEVNTNFYEKYLLVEEIIKEQEKNPNSIPLGFISNLAYNNGFTFDTINLDNDVLYFLVFNQGTSEQFIYSFAIKYEWGDLK